MKDTIIPLETKTKIKVKIGKIEELKPIVDIYGCNTPRGSQHMDSEQRFFDPR